GNALCRRRTTGYPHGRQWQQLGAHELTNPGPQPHLPVVPSHAARMTIDVAFFSLGMQVAPRCCCALAANTVAPSTNTIPVKVSASFRITRPNRTASRCYVGFLHITSL